MMILKDVTRKNYYSNNTRVVVQKGTESPVNNTMAHTDISIESERDDSLLLLWVSIHETPKYDRREYRDWHHEEKNSSYIQKRWMNRAPKDSSPSKRESIEWRCVTWDERISSLAVIITSPHFLPFFFNHFLITLPHPSWHYKQKTFIYSSFRHIHWLPFYPQSDYD